MARVEPFERYTREYEEWFETNHFAYLSELQAIREKFPGKGRALEIGVGSGRFAAPLGINIGVEPSRNMGKLAGQKGIRVVAGIAERLPFRDAAFDAAIMVTTLCFLDDVRAAFTETYRILKDGGTFMVGFIDKDSPIGRQYERHKAKSPFYNIASFYSADEVKRFLLHAGFGDISFVQTIFRSLPGINRVEPVKTGYGEGSFLVAKGLK
jgi:SAM-dependent methyltransferase